MDNFNFAQQGWQCPICKRVYSPLTMMCYYCGGESITTTGTDIKITGTGVDYQKEPSSFTVSTGYATYTAEDNIRTCDNCKHNAGLPSYNGTRYYRGACTKCVAKDMWESKND